VTELAGRPLIGTQSAGTRAVRVRLLSIGGCLVCAAAVAAFRSNGAPCTRSPIPRPETLSVRSGDRDAAIQPIQGPVDWHGARSLAGRYSVAMVDVDHGREGATGSGVLELWVNSGDTWPSPNRYHVGRPLLGRLTVPLRTLTRFPPGAADPQHPDSYGVTTEYLERDSLRSFTLSVGGAPGSDTILRLDAGGDARMSVVRMDSGGFAGWWSDGGFLAPSSHGYFCAARTNSAG
jgi:hypothetical protein